VSVLDTEDDAVEDAEVETVDVWVVDGDVCSHKYVPL
jgi:hypothetical protein